MKNKILITTIFLVSFTAIVFAVSSGGTKTDPLITENKLNQLLDQNIDEYINEKLDNIELSNEKIAGNIISSQVDKISYVLNDKISDLNTGDKITVISGNVTVSGTGSLIDISDGTEIKNPKSLKLQKQYVVAENSNFTITVSSLTSKINIVGGYSFKSQYQAQYTDYANALDDLGLFKGTEYGYELNRPATRLEGLVMLIRLLGEEEQALNFSGSHNFTDIPAWGDKYVAYAFNKGYTTGITDTIFSPNKYIRDIDYYTFILRALGYEDDVDFTWLGSYDTAIKIGIVPANFAKKDVFYRDDVVFSSFNSLSIKIHDSAIL